MKETILLGNHIHLSCFHPNSSRPSSDTRPSSLLPFVRTGRTTVTGNGGIPEMQLSRVQTRSSLEESITILDLDPNTIEQVLCRTMTPLIINNLRTIYTVRDKISKRNFAGTLLLPFISYFISVFILKFYIFLH